MFIRGTLLSIMCFKPTLLISSKEEWDAKAGEAHILVLKMQDSR